MPSREEIAEQLWNALIDSEVARADVEAEGQRLRDALRKGFLLTILMRTFCELQEPLDKNAAEKMGEFMREAEKLLGASPEVRIDPA